MSFYNRNKTPCKYFQQGKCKKGNSCNFAHVFTNDSGRPNYAGRAAQDDRYSTFINPSNLTKYTQEITDDMNTVRELQLNPLTSSYGLGQPCSANLISERDLSQEESRFLYYQSREQNMIPSYETQMAARSNDIQKCVSFIKNDPRKAARYLQLATQKKKETGDSQKMKPFIEFPLDLSGQSYHHSSNNVNLFGTMSGSSETPFGSAPSGNSSFFGKKIENQFNGSSNTTQSGQTPMANGAAFGSSAFGKPSFGVTGAPPSTGGVFGQPSFGSSSNTGVGFGNVSNTGSVFGAPKFGSGSATTGVFGNTSFGASPFGKPFSNDVSSSQTAFGNPSNPSSFGSSASSKTSTLPFGNIAQQSSANPSPFASLQTGAGKPNSLGLAAGASGLGANTSVTPFGSNPKNSGATFGSAFGTSNTHSQPSSGGSAFGVPSFGKSSGQNPFGTSSNSPSPFASLAGSQASETSAFGAPQLPPNSTAINSAAPTTFAPFGTQNSVSSTSSFKAKSPAIVGGAPASQASYPIGQRLPMSDYVRIEDLPEDILSAFKADKFSLGSVPEVLPPAELTA
ncbi:LAFE_0H06216g1_1 [Lachancea fermentati]|uniref:LAFE_0H06216g1_1 n=1 Tax=Lachancea fermentati TaxID=4955 RepID=A0A1G4MJR1_LACFM|nr:LAFE_0H06216g1_1 [Lachancea fermentati]